MAKPRNKWYRFENATTAAPAKLTIEGDIGPWGVSSKDFRASVGRLGDSEPLSLHICSGGGDIFSGQEIANIIRGHKGKVSATLGSVCASIATVIASAASSVTAAKNTIYMIHRASGFAGGDADDMRKTAEIMEKLEAGIVAAYVEKTGMDEDKLAEMMDDETWMDAGEALAMGFIDAIGEEDAEDEILDTVDLAHYRNSATLLSRLQLEPAASGVRAGNGRGLTLQAIRNAAFPPVSPSPVPKNQSNPIVKTAEELAAEKTEINRLAKEEAKNIVAAQNARAKEIRAVVAQVAKRDKKDFSALADDFISRDDSVDNFCRAILNSETFVPIKQEVVGSGIELIEPMDAYRGTAGFNFVNSEDFKSLAAKFVNKGRHNFTLTLNVPHFLNATQTSASPNQLTIIEYVPGISPLGVRVLKIKDLIMGGATNSTTIRYRREDAFANAATAVTETGALPNVAVSVAEVDAPVKDIGGYIEMSENLMADYLAVTSFINQRLPYMVERATEDELLNGDGTGAHITGLLATQGLQTEAKGTDTNVDAIHKALTIVRFVPNGTQANAQGGYEPDAIVMNPVDWQLIRLAKDTAGQYLAGGPFTGAYGNGAYSNVFSVWGKMVVVTPVIAAGTALVGAFRECSQYFQRQGITIEMTNSNGTNFINRIVTLRAAERLALTVPQPNGFATVTGIA